MRDGVREKKQSPTTLVGAIRSSALDGEFDPPPSPQTTPVRLTGGCCPLSHQNQFPLQAATARLATLSDRALSGWVVGALTKLLGDAFKRIAIVWVETRERELAGLEAREPIKQPLEPYTVFVAEAQQLRNAWE